MTTTDRPRRRLVVYPVAIGTYRHQRDLEVDAEVAAVGQLLAAVGAEVEPWDASGGHRDHRAVIERVNAWAESPAGDAILYWVGHGWSNHPHATLAHADSPDPVEQEGITPELLAYRINKWEHGNTDPDAWAMIVIDTCKSARFVELLNGVLDDRQGPRRLVLVGVSGKGPTNLGEFTRALRRALTESFAAVDEIRLWHLAMELQVGLPNHCQVIPKYVSDVVLRRIDLAVPAGSTLDVAQEIRAALARLSEDERRHYVPKAQGGELGELAWYFEGRASQRRVVAAWLRDRRTGMLVVTGPAGSGKSALLGNLLMHSRPALRRVLVDSGLTAELPDDEQPAADVFTAAIHLTGLTAVDLVGRLAGGLGTRPPGAGLPLSEQIDLLLEDAGAKRVPATVLVDALDEAVDPITIARAVLRPLAAIPHLRLVIGTRRSTRERTDNPAPDDKDLLDALGVPSDDVVAVERDQEAIARYVRRRLSTAAERGQLDTSEFAIESAVETIRGSGGEFLFARLAVHELLASPELLTPAGVRDLVELSHGNHRDLFARAVRRLEAGRRAARPLLEALARAWGRGLPMLDGIWLAVAAAVAPSSVPITAEDASALLAEAAPYLMLDVEHGQTVYRLAHRTFAEFFIDQSSPDGRAQHEHRHLAITRRLLSLVEEEAGSPNPYLATYVSAHAGAGGEPAWQLVAAHPSALDNLDPTAVTSDAMRTAFGQFSLPAEIAGVIGARHLLRGARAEDRPGLRQLAMASHAAVRHPDRRSGSASAAWSVSWATLRQLPTHLTLRTGTGAVTAMAAITRADATTLLAAASGDGRVHVWDPFTGTEVTAPFTGRWGRITALAALPRPDGVTLLAAGTDQGVVHLWNPVSGSVSEFHGGLASISALAPTRLRDGVVGLVIGTTSGIRVWRPTTRTFTFPGITYPFGSVRAVVSFPRRDGSALIVAGGSDGTVRMVDGESGAAFGHALSGHAGAVVALSTVNAENGGQLLVTGDAGGTVRTWDPISRTEVRSRWAMDGHELHALGVVRGGSGQTWLAGGDSAGFIKLWRILPQLPDADDSAPVVLAGHRERVTALAALPSGVSGRDLLASASADGTVRIWAPDLRDGGLVEADRASAPIRALGAERDPAGALVVVAVHDDGTMARWNVHTGTRLTALLPVTERAETGAVTVVTAGGSVLVVCGGRGGVVRVWDTAAGRRVYQLGSGGPRPVDFLCVYDDGVGRPVVAACSAAGELQSWELGSGQPVARLALLTGEVTAFTVLPASDWPPLLASAGHDGRITLLDPLSGMRFNTLRTRQPGGVRALAPMRLAGGGPMLLAASDEGSVELWHPVEGALLFRAALGSPVTALTAISATEVAVATQGGLVVLNLHCLAN